MALYTNPVAHFLFLLFTPSLAPFSIAIKGGVLCILSALVSIKAGCIVIIKINNLFFSNTATTAMMIPIVKVHLDFRHYFIYSVC